MLEQDIISLLKTKKEARDILQIDEIVLEQHSGMPDLFLRMKDGTYKKVEVETRLTNYFRHKHDKLPPGFIEEVWCWKNDIHTRKKKEPIPYKITVLSEELKDLEGIEEFFHEQEINREKERIRISNLPKQEVKSRKKYNFTATIEYVPFPSEEARDRAYKTWVELYIQGEKARIKYLADKAKKPNE